jgi:lysophospholipase L1-like esterase
MTIDFYPDQDAWLRFQRRVARVGAAALLFENHPELWPEFDGQDLVTTVPWCTLENRASNGAIIETILQSQLPTGMRPDVWLVTMTIGGNDLLGALFETNSDIPIAHIQERYAMVVERVRATFPSARLILNTIYDPTEGTGHLPGGSDLLPVHHLLTLNDHIRTIATQSSDVALAHVHAHFQGHRDWYLPGNPIEPGASGANEIRRLWWQLRPTV